MAKKKTAKKTANPTEEAPEEEPKEEPKEEKPEKEEKPKEKPAKTVAGDWYDQLLGNAEKGSKDLPPALKVAADQTIGFLRENKDDFLDMGEEAFNQFLGIFASGKRAKARDFYIQTKLGPESLVAAMRASTKRLEAALEKQRTFDDQMTRFLEKVTVLGANVLKNLLFAAL